MEYRILPNEMMSVIVDGKEEKRQIAYTQVVRHCLLARYPEIKNGERVVQTMNGKTLIITDYENSI